MGSFRSFVPTNSQPAGQGLGRFSQGTDLGKAQALVQHTWPERAGRPVKACIGTIFDAVKRVERSLPREVLSARPRQWTERRVRSIWQGEARRIDSYEMEDLETAAQGEAYSEFSNSLDRAARMAEFLQAGGSDLARPAHDRLRQFFGELAGPRVG